MCFLWPPLAAPTLSTCRIAAQPLFWYDYTYGSFLGVSLNIWIILIVELLKLLPSVISWLKRHPKADRKELLDAFPGEVKGILKRLKEERAVGSAPDLV